MLLSRVWSWICSMESAGRLVLYEQNGYKDETPSHFNVLGELCDFRLFQTSTQVKSKPTLSLFSFDFFSHQAESDQRLIYAGKLLPDHLHIRDLFTQVNMSELVFVCLPNAASRYSSPMWEVNNTRGAMENSVHNIIQNLLTSGSFRVGRYG